MIAVAQWADLFERALKGVRPGINVGLAAYGKVVEELAKSFIGTERNEWPPLAESTIETKERLGYAVPAPLLRTGDMRDSIEYQVDPAELEMIVGSKELKALWQEIGTIKMPPPPFLRTALFLSEPEAEKIFGDLGVELLSKGAVRE